ncbi:uncharacterized protein [Macaca fascicularis]|uniref:uncharacterized protein n=1 Tax=Macaca fascicularis TaxID=9541 RepID=UPI0032B0678A
MGATVAAPPDRERGGHTHKSSIMRRGSPYVDQAGLELLGASDPPTSASQSAGVTGARHRAWLSPLQTQFPLLGAEWQLSTTFCCEDRRSGAHTALSAAGAARASPGGRDRRQRVRTPGRRRARVDRRLGAGLVGSARAPPPPRPRSRLPRAQLRARRLGSRAAPDVRPGAESAPSAAQSAQSRRGGHARPRPELRLSRARGERGRLDGPGPPGARAPRPLPCTPVPAPGLVAIAWGAGEGVKQELALKDLRHAWPPQPVPHAWPPQPAACTPRLAPTACTPRLAPTACTPRLVPTACSPRLVPTACTPRLVPTACSPRLVPTACSPRLAPTACTTSGAPHSALWFSVRPGIRGNFGGSHPTLGSPSICPSIPASCRVVSLVSSAVIYWW